MQKFLGTNEDRVTQFKSFTDEFCAMARTEGVSVLPYEGSGPEHFALLPEVHQVAVLEQFGRYVEVAREVVAQGISLHDDNVFVWRMLQKLKVRPPSDLMDQLRTGEVVEIYNSNFIQIYRNMRFFEICSYSLDDVLSRPFWDLIAREKSITELIVQQASRLLQGFPEGIMKFDVPEHVISEIHSPRMNTVRVQQRIGATLWSPERAPVALIASLNVRSAVTSRHEQGAAAATKH
jgi:hypothetical protein